MNCFTDHENGMEVLLDYCYGALSGKKAEAVTAHASQCPECQRLIDAQRTVLESLEDFSAPEVSAGFDQQLFARIAREGRPPVWKRWFGHSEFALWWKPALAAGFTAALLAVVLIFPGRHDSPSKDAASKQTRIEHVDIEQVEQALEDLDLLAPQSSSGPM